MGFSVPGKFSKGLQFQLNSAFNNTIHLIGMNFCRRAARQKKCETYRGNVYLSG